ncbi:MAG: MFS transporter [Bauldia sp.]
MDQQAPGAPAASKAAIELAPQRRRLVTAIILLAFFMDVLDTSIVNVAIPAIQDGLGASYAAIQWVIAGYSLAFALFLITGGRLGDIFGYRTLFVAGMVGFTIASALSGLAPTIEVLIAARFLQGTMAAVMVPQILSTIQVIYAREERKNVTGFYGAAAGLASVMGPVVGALLIAADIGGLGWRMIFLVNVPVGIAAAIAAALFQPDARSPSPLKIDAVGVGLILLAMLLLMYPLIQGRELDWPAWTFLAMAASLPVFAAFAWSQVAKERRDGSPLLVPGLFALPAFVVGIAINASLYAVIAAFFLTFTIHLQIGLNFSVLAAGLTGIPFSIGIGLTAGLSGPVLVPRFGRNLLSVGALTMAAGCGLVAAAAGFFGGALQSWQLAPGLFIAGAGMGMIVAPVVAFILAGVPVQDAGSASGVISAVGQVGSAIGVAVIGVIFFGAIAERADEATFSVEAALRADLTAAGVNEFAANRIFTQFQICFADIAGQKSAKGGTDDCRPENAAANLAAQGIVGDRAGIQRALVQRAREAGEWDFARAFVEAVGWQIAWVLAIFALTFFLPRVPATPETAGAAA